MLFYSGTPLFLGHLVLLFCYLTFLWGTFWNYWLVCGCVFKVWVCSMSTFLLCPCDSSSHLPCVKLISPTLPSVLFSISTYILHTIVLWVKQLQITRWRASLEVDTTEAQTCTRTQPLHKQVFVSGIEGKAGIYSLICQSPLLMATGPGSLG